MPEFWEKNFLDKKAMWGLFPANSAIMARDLFLEHHLTNILIPGIGYGRNAQPLLESNMRVTGIEISETAISIARDYFGNKLNIHHGSVTEMPFDDALYDGIYCHGLIHLLDRQQRLDFLKNCFQQLCIGGQMIFTTISKNDKSFGKGKQISKDRYEVHKGVYIYFYDHETIKSDFTASGLYQIDEIEENQNFYLIRCKK